MAARLLPSRKHGGGGLPCQYNTGMENIIINNLNYEKD